MNIARFAVDLDQPLSIGNGAELTAHDGCHLTHVGSIFMAGQVIDRIPGFKR
jgi:hypothetical protein